MGFKIFIVDDDATMREMLSDFCKSRYKDAEVLTYETGELALENLYLKPEVIVLDYYLDSVNEKAMNGIVVLGRMKELLPHTPVIFLSSQENPQIAADTIKHGAYDYIVKNETAFQRLEIMINNATGHLSMKMALQRQRIFNYILFGLIAVGVFYFIWMAFTS